ncbi:SAM-dependent methyltransferase, partial [Amaricoccus sp. W119]|uniref:SAM-dependent methyltransferase n=1 Tax=Amaricoccus sp. W119 TaxID=3391833 RepID=UPI0039A49E87
MSMDPAVFDRMYSENIDPWGYETSAYEAEKYALSLGLLGARRFPQGVEIGCSIGVLSEQIARRCDYFLGVDAAEAALVRARSRGVANAEFRRAVLPRDWPCGAWDLIVLSEVLYFFDADDIAQLAHDAARTLSGNGVVLLASYLGDTETELDGPASEEMFIE